MRGAILLCCLVFATGCVDDYAGKPAPPEYPQPEPVPTEVRCCG